MDNEKLALLTINDLCQLLADNLDCEHLDIKDFKNCDFAFADECYVRNDVDLETIKYSSSGWYGIKAVDPGFDSDDIMIVAGYYGGQIVPDVIFNQIDNRVEAQRKIWDVIKEALDCGGEYFTADTMLIVEFS